MQYCRGSMYYKVDREDTLQYCIGGMYCKVYREDTLQYCRGSMYCKVYREYTLQYCRGGECQQFLPTIAPHQGAQSPPSTILGGYFRMNFKYNSDYDFFWIQLSVFLYLFLAKHQYLCNISHYIILNNEILKSNSSVFLWSEGYISQYTP